MTSRWADTESDARLEAQDRAEKEEKKRRKADKRRKQEEQEAAQQQQREQRSEPGRAPNGLEAEDGRPAKRQKVSVEPEELPPAKLLRFPGTQWGPCRHVDNFERLNHIEEGSYGWVSRAKETATGEIVALKKLKMEGSKDGFPITGLREIQTLLESRHPNIVELREVVMGETLDDIFLVMPFLEHDLKTLLEDQPEPFLPSEIKTLLYQLTSALSYLHSNYILHRDLKTSNLLLSNRGVLKIADFGMARYTSTPPPPNLTQLVVTLWYRSPDLLLGATTYNTDVDMWSLGCIFGELLSQEPLLQGKNEVDQLAKIFALCGIPTTGNWPGYKRLKNAKSLRLPPTSSHNLSAILHARFPALTASGTALLSSLLSLNPAARPSADEVLQHPYFTEDPRPKSSAMFPTFPSKGGQERRRRRASPNAPKRGDAPGLADDVDFGGIFGKREEERGGGFSLRMG